MRRLFLDANYPFTAVHNPTGKASLIIRLGREGHWALATSDYGMNRADQTVWHRHPDGGGLPGVALSGMAISIGSNSSPKPSSSTQAS